MFCLSSPSAFKIPQYWLALLYISVSLIFLLLSKFLPHCLLVSMALFSLVSVFRLSLRAVCLLSWIFWFLWVFWTSLDLICNLIIFHQVSPLQSDLPLFHQPFGKGSERSLFAAPHCFCKAQVENSVLQLWKLLSFTIKKKLFGCICAGKERWIAAGLSMLCRKLGNMWLLNWEQCFEA